MNIIDGHQMICKLAVEGQKPKVVGINVPPGADWSGINALISVMLCDLGRRGSPMFCWMLINTETIYGLYVEHLKPQ